MKARCGIKVFQEMKENDDTVGAILFAIKMLIRQVEWHVEPGGDSAKDKEAAEFVESCMDDMQATWTDTISEILSFLPYGWSFHEIVWGTGRVKVSFIVYSVDGEPFTVDSIIEV